MIWTSKSNDGELAHNFTDMHQFFYDADHPDAPAMSFLAMFYIRPGTLKPEGKADWPETCKA
ncbi:hypothetical protein [Marinobacter sp. bablab_jr008]|jgi:hypothetical protein|uniref:hypothetical protein n=1 Tax=Marinobacter sp. bablab_jr008 TaxID=2755064 RepID=UPI0018F1C7C1|nr:hypothetical protein [Marinobacter sp. bablab_jr008]